MLISNWQKKFNKLRLKENPFEYDFNLKVFSIDDTDNNLSSNFNNLISDLKSLNTYVINNLNSVDRKCIPIKTSIKFTDNPKYIGRNIIKNYEFDNIYLSKEHLSFILSHRKLDIENIFIDNYISDIVFKILIKLNSSFSLMPYLVYAYLEDNDISISKIKGLYFYDNKSNCMKYIEHLKLEYLCTLAPFSNNYMICSDPEDRINFDIYTYYVYYMNIICLYELLYHINKLSDDDKCLLFKFLDCFNNSVYSKILNISFTDKINCDENVEKIINETNIEERFKLLKNIDIMPFFSNFISIDPKEFTSTGLIDTFIDIMKSKALYTISLSYFNDFNVMCKVNNIKIENLNLKIKGLQSTETRETKNFINLWNNVKTSSNKYNYNIINSNTKKSTPLSVINNYNNILNKAKIVNKLLIKEIKEIKTYNQNMKNPKMNCGKLDIKNIHNYKTDKNIFYNNTYKTREQDLVFGILLDCSGSMYGNGIINGRTTMIILDETLKALNINHCIYGHDSDEFHQCNIYKYSYFKNDPKYTLSKNYNLANLESLEGNCDSAALAYVENELLNQPNKDKICLIFSDGEPTECTDEELKEQIKSMEKKGIKVIGIGIDFENIREYYNDYANGKNLKDMFDIISKILKEYVLEKI